MRQKIIREGVEEAMGKKNNVNPNHYKTRGRERQGDEIVQEVHKQEYAQAQAAAGESAPNFIPGASPVGESNSQARSRATGETGQVNESANSTNND